MDKNKKYGRRLQRFLLVKIEKYALITYEKYFCSKKEFADMFCKPMNILTKKFIKLNIDLLILAECIKKYVMNVDPNKFSNNDLIKIYHYYALLQELGTDMDNIYNKFLNILFLK